MILLAIQEQQRTNSSAVPKSYFNTLGQNKPEQKHLLFVLYLLSLYMTLLYKRRLPFALIFMCIYNIFGTQSKKYTRNEIETNQIFQFVYHIDQGQLIYVQLSPNSIQLMKEGQWPKLYSNGYKGAFSLNVLYLLVMQCVEKTPTPLNVLRHITAVIEIIQHFYSSVTALMVIAGYETWK